MDKRTIQTGIRVLKKQGLLVFVKKTFDYFLDVVRYPYLVLKYSFYKPRYPASFHQVFSNSFRGFRPAQIPEEIQGLLELLKQKKPKTMLEVGTGKGGTLFLFSSVLPLNSKIITLDMRGGTFGAGYPFWMIPLLKTYRQGKQKQFLVQSDSHDEKTLKKIKKILQGEQLDFLFIDGDHSYPGVKRDFELYSQLVRKNGIIALHDIVVTEGGCTVYKFWDEIKKKYKSQEFLGRKKVYGIGVVENN